MYENTRVEIPESKSVNNFSRFAAESQVQNRSKLNVIFPPEKLLKRGQIASFSKVRLKQGVSLKSFKTYFTAESWLLEIFGWY